MIPSEAEERRSDWKADLSERLHDPLQLRIILIGIVVAVGYAGIYMPLSEDIAKTKSAIEHEQRLLGLAETIEQLEKGCDSYKDRLPGQADSKEWIQFMLNGIRGYSLKLRKLNCLPKKNVGPYQVVVMEVDLEGTFYELDQFLRWLETNPRIFRVDEINLELLMKPRMGGPPGSEPVEQNKDDMVMQIQIVGMAG